MSLIDDRVNEARALRQARRCPFCGRETCIRMDGFAAFNGRKFFHGLCGKSWVEYVTMAGEAMIERA